MKRIRYYLPIIEIKSSKVMIHGRSFFDQTVENNLKAYNNIRKYRTGPSDDYTTGCLPDYPYFEKCHKLIAIDLSKQKTLHAEPKAIQQINFTEI